MGMNAFVVVWIGQLVSLLGTGMTRFALAFWAWQETGEATALALVGLFSFGPTVLFSPIAGALVDRWDRKTVMMLSDLAAGLSSVVIVLLYAGDSLQIWHLYVAGAFAGAFESFQFPAYSAAISTMLPKEQYGRANGMLSLAQSASEIAAPVFAAGLLVTIGIAGILAIDIITFMIAIGALLMVHIPQPQRTAAGRRGQGSLLQESGYGFRYIYERPSLLGLQLTFFSINLIATLSFVLLTPMILARTANDAGILAGVESAAGIGGVLGGLAMSTWGGPKRRVHGVLGGMALSSLLGNILIGSNGGVIAWIVGAFFASFFIPIINGSNQAIWQAKVAPDVQGRVFAVRRLIAQITAPLAMGLAGPLADRVFEPAMQSGGSLATTFGGLVGVGVGSGMGLIFVITGLLGVLVGLGGYAFRAIRNAEDILPDHDVQPIVEPSTEAAAEAQA
jgi:MFS family permease